MKPRTLLGTALVTTVSAALAVGTQVPSYTAPLHPAARRRRSTARPDRPPSTRPQEYVGDHRSLFRAAAGDAFQRVATTAGSAGTHYVAYERTHHGLPVVGGDFVVAVNDDGKVTGRTLAQEQTIDLARSPRRSAAAAARRPRAPRSPRSTRSARPSWSCTRRATPRLAWETLVTGREAGFPTKLHVFDRRHAPARSSTPGTWSSRAPATATTTARSHSTPPARGTSWSMTDTTRSGHAVRRPERRGVHRHRRRLGQRLRHQPRDRLRRRAVRDATRSGTCSRPGSGRNGINGNGTGYPARVGLNEVNAYWNGCYTNFGHSPATTSGRLTAIDVVAHEYGHGIFQTTPGGAGGGNENGGINEATGDIFGAMTEAYATQPERPAGLPGRRGGQPGRQRPDPQHVQPGAPLGDPNCWSTVDPEHRGARRRRVRSTTGSTCCRQGSNGRRRPARPATARR